jgi:DNA-binding transcriptional ArsR family regulator
MTIMKFCSVFEALGCEIRLKVFDFIMQAGEDGVAPKEIVEQFGVDSGTLQFHLKKLMNVNLVSKKIPEEIGVITAQVISQPFFSN